jgi:hypothetical protein
LLFFFLLQCMLGFPRPSLFHVRGRMPTPACFGIDFFQIGQKTSSLQQLSPRLGLLYHLVHAMAVTGVFAPSLLIGSALRWGSSAVLPATEPLLLSTLLLPLLAVASWLTFVHLAAPRTHLLVLFAGVVLANVVVAVGAPASLQALSCLLPPTAVLLAGAC